LRIHKYIYLFIFYLNKNKYIYIHIFYILQKYHENHGKKWAVHIIKSVPRRNIECKQVGSSCNTIVSISASTGCLHLLFFSALQLFIRGRRGIIFNGNIRACIMCLCVRLTDMFTRMVLIPHYHARQECHETLNPRSPHNVIRNNRCTTRTRPVMWVHTAEMF